MPESSVETEALVEATRLLRRLRGQVLEARTTAQSLQVPLVRAGELRFEQGRVRGIIDQLSLVSRTAHQLRDDLESIIGEVANG